MNHLASFALLRDVFVLADARSGRVLADHGLSMLQFDVLRVLSEAEGQRMSRLATRLLCDDSTLTRAVNHLVEAGWAERRVDSSDRRATLVLLTGSGKIHFEAVSGSLRNDLDRTWGSLSSDEVMQLHRSLRRLVDQLHALEMQ